MNSRRPLHPLPIYALLFGLAAAPAARAQDSVALSGAVDARYHTLDHSQPTQAWLNAAEIDLTRPLTAGTRTVGKVLVQVIGETSPNAHGGGDAQLGEFYVQYRLPLGLDSGDTAFLKVGQFQVPFGLLATYDPHLRLMQPLYSQALGIRLDSGASVSGNFYGQLHYDFTITGGGGPNHLYFPPNRLVAFRLGRTFDTRFGTVVVGGSLLTGHLPVTDPTKTHPFAVELPASGRVEDDRIGNFGNYVDKSRIAADGTYTFKSVLVRAEAMTGADKDARVLGYYAEGNYHFTPRAEVSLSRTFWSYPEGNSSSVHEGLGLTYTLGPGVSLGALAEYLHDVPRDTHGTDRRRYTAQVLYRF